MANSGVLLIAGASGFIGSAFRESVLPRYAQVRCLTRSDNEARDGLRDKSRDGSHSGQREVFQWDPARRIIDDQAIAGADAVVCLNGAPINRMWTKKYRKTLWESRIGSVRTLVDAISRTPQDLRPRVLLSGSAVGYYGYDADQPVSEDTPAGKGFLAQLCRAWEHEANRAEQYGVRVVNIRTGLVMHPSGGLMKAMLPLFRSGLGGRIGDGSAWMPIISRRDYVNALHHCIEHEEISGRVNFTAPHPARNAQWTQDFAEFVHRPAVFVAPKSVLQLVLGNMAKETILASQQVVPDVLLKSGFVFEAATSTEIFSSFRSKHSEA
ncbi:TIGR01777 family oxidoreductase [Arcanobacterium bovis]|uniref:TIGR01777 family protein n=1 Tax=Arcanobacterium bovis TaxID=2529275 RepID=A0A4Q9V2K0_9ACTO|nr:TIGR01777 family oxidoreductase [Arcanobacterium bovis]TBW22787.1 TIGR01777 family protein [Arcanobacterium bovis]